MRSRRENELEKDKKKGGGDGDLVPTEGALAVPFQAFAPPPLQILNCYAHDHDTTGGGWGSQHFQPLGLLVGLPAPSPDPLPTLLRAKIENKVTRPFSHPAAEYLRGFQFPRLYCGQSGEDWGRSGRGVRRQVLERHVKAGRGGGGCALK